MDVSARQSTSTTTGDPAAIGTIRVWDPLVRIFHWTVVAGCTVNLVWTEGGAVHRWIGYTVAGAVTVRLGWGYLSHGHARFSAFVPKPAELKTYLVRMIQRREPRYIGHNPAGAIMMCTLMGVLAAVCVTGWMLGWDRFWGDETLQEVHEGLANAIVPLAVVHVLAAVVEGFRHHENLVKSMITGRKRRASDGDIDNATDPH